MKIEHIAIWTNKLEEMKEFYMMYFNATSNEKYSNSKKFESYFLTFESGSRIELMTSPQIEEIENNVNLSGYHHIAISVGSRQKVDELTLEIEKDGFTVFGSPRKTGDGYYESVIIDPDGNKIEITV